MSGVHVIYNGRNEDLPFEQLFTPERMASVGIAEGTVISSSNITEDQVKHALSQYYDVGVGEFVDHFVELNPNGNVTVRPNTPFGG